MEVLIKDRFEEKFFGFKKIFNFMILFFIKLIKIDFRYIW